MTPEDTEALLTETLAQCRDGIAACFANAVEAVDRTSPYFRKTEMEHAVALLNAQARVAASLALLRRRSTKNESPDRGSIGRAGENESPNRGSNGQVGVG